RFVAAIDSTSRRPWWDVVRRPWTQFWIWGMAPTVPPPPHEWLSNAVESGTLPLAVDSGRVYLAGRSGELRALDRSTRYVEWERMIGPLQDGPIRGENGLLVWTGESLLLLDPGSGVETKRRELGNVTVLQVVPTSHGTYVMGADGTLLALR